MITEAAIQPGTVIHSRHIDEAFTETLKSVLEYGYHVETYPYSQPDKARGSTEILNFQVSIDNPRDRLLTNPARPFNCVEAIARLVWMLGANNRLEDIAFYQPKARLYSDNQITIPGSSYGMRIFDARPGLNQVEGVIKTLRNEAGSRRGAIVIWLPEDAVRESHDIPCAFGMFFHLRQGRLICTTLMRSNNAFLLLPYNVFEFSLLAEMIATTIGVELGSYVHCAVSMHVYDDQRVRAEEAIALHKIVVENQPRQAMPRMPGDPLPFEQANELVRLEAQLHHEFTLKTPEELFTRGEKLHEYWRAFYNVLLIQVLAHSGRLSEAKNTARHLPEYLQEPMERQLCR